MDETKLQGLVQSAKAAMAFSYAPYSKFRVGAAVLAGSGKVYTGVNVENASYGATLCAERVAICKAISEGENKIHIIAIASDLEDYIYPCGICRQFMSEFSQKDMLIVCSRQDGQYIVKKLEEILPNSFAL